MSNSTLTKQIFLVPSFLCGGRKGNQISKITIHHQAGHLTGYQCYMAWVNAYTGKKTYASANYSICDGEVTLLVDEKDRAFTSSSAENDRQAVTIEVANVRGAGDSKDPDKDWMVSQQDYDKLIDLCADICYRNGFRLKWTGDKTGSLTAHRMFAATHCPGDYLYKRMPEIAEKVNAKLDQMIEEEEDKNMTEEKFNEFMQAWLSKQASMDASTWALGGLEDAVARGITDGKRPQSFCTRQEAVIMINNATKGGK